MEKNNDFTNIAMIAIVAIVAIIGIIILINTKKTETQSSYIVDDATGQVYKITTKYIPPQPMNQYGGILTKNYEEEETVE